MEATGERAVNETNAVDILALLHDPRSLTAN